MVDPLRVASLLDRLGREVTALERLASRDPVQLRGDDDLLAAVKYRFIVAIERCIDIGRHLAASEGWRTPQDYADVFAVLSENDAVEPRMAATLRDVARFRNVLVHDYVAVDDDRVVDILRTPLPDLRSYRPVIAELVKQLS